MSRLLRRVRRPRLPAFELPEVHPARTTKAAVILDPFSELAFGYEWHQVKVTPTDWRAVLTEQRPDLLFVESAWNGNDGAWRLHMTRDHQPSPELRALVAWCRDEGIPTVFWNKEDPPNYDVFLETARLFDQVFTVDADRIPVYQRDLGHERIDLLPFSAQPRLHNPVRRGKGRVLPIAFAGTWFAEKHPERREQMEQLLRPALDRGLHIWSRMQRGDKRYRFPAPYRSHVVGSLPYPKMLAAYSAYKVFLNVNSVTGSKTMCSRRLFELSAAQTAVITTPAASIEPFFGSDLEVVRDADEARAAIDVLLGQDEYRDRQALKAHRRVFDEHLCTHRVDTVLRSLGLDLPLVEERASASVSRPGEVISTGSTTTQVSAVVPTMRPEQLDHVLAMLGSQSHRDLQLVLVTHGFEAPADLAVRAARAGLDNVVTRYADASLTLGACMNLGVDAADGELVAKVDDDNFYGRHYLTDLVRALDYSGADVAGKWAHLVHLESSGATLLRFEHAEHRFTDLVQGGTLLTRRELARDVRFEDLPRRVDTTFLEKVKARGLTTYSADRFNFVSVRRVDPGSHTWPITEKQLMARSSRLLFYGNPYPHAEA
ncbi:glycosyltransferase family protein [Nocardioides sp. Root140]|uniref:glycosyltransferase family protein n=1 Tax=Nocardioides sp. Root140 TaxID=1736460 RepID=UPI000A938631|nr:glycosyltransferase [Nocardioides sp. Root140]